MTGAMTPLPYRVVTRRVETADTVTLDLAPLGDAIGQMAPGQFSMVYAFGTGEVPISFSADPGDGSVTHTLRAVGAVTKALHDAHPGKVVGLRGPYGNGWALPGPAGAHLLLVAGGIGLAPLRPVLLHALKDRQRYGRVVLLIGARTPGELLYADSYDAWRAGGADVRVTVDRADTSWAGSVGVVTALLGAAVVDPARTVAYVCGPDVMMRLTAAGLRRLGVPAGGIQVSLERNMRCGVAWCGHCQLGPLLLCRDGPVVPYDVAGPLMAVREL
jgi:anaerobic sulfite reductase subunit B